MKRFWDKVDIKNKDECWNWKACKDGAGYGVIRINNKNINSHRFAYEDTYKISLEKQHVLHKCDNPICCNPNHLFLGTTQDNTQDKVNKNRQVRGHTHSNSKVSEDIVRKIRSMYSTTDTTLAKLAKLFNLSIAGIYSIVSFRTWKHVL